MHFGGVDFGFAIMLKAAFIFLYLKNLSTIQNTYSKRNRVTQKGLQINKIVRLLQSPNIIRHPPHLNIFT